MSPDGTKIAAIAFEDGFIIPIGVLVRRSDREPDGGVYIYDIASKALTKVRDSGSRVRWLPDGRTLVIQDGGALYVADLVTKQVRQFPFPQHTAIIARWADPFWTDGKSACWVEQLNEADVWLVEVDSK